MNNKSQQLVDLFLLFMLSSEGFNSLKDIIDNILVKCLDLCSELSQRLKKQNPPTDHLFPVSVSRGFLTATPL